MSIISLASGNISDAAGNVATLSCPALTIEDSSDDYVYPEFDREKMEIHTCNLVISTKLGA